MRTIGKFSIVLFIAITFFSCSKDEETTIDNSGSKEHYMPLTTGNYWNYAGESLNYTVTIGDKEIVDGIEYYYVENSVSTSNDGYIRYDGNKLHQVSTISSTYISAQKLDMLMLDEDAVVGDTWTACSFESSVAGFYSWTTNYTGELTAYHETYTLDNVIYNDVVEVTIYTSITDFKFSDAMIAQIGEENAADFEELYKNNISKSLVSQHTFYAKGIGFIYQYSNQYTALGVKLVDYKVQ